MSSRPLLQPAPVIINGSMSSNITSAVTIISNISMMSYSYSWSGTSPVGNIVVEVSDDYTQNAAGTVSNPGTWSALPLSASTAITGNSGNGYIDIDFLGAYAIRTRYIRTSGTGTLNAIYKGKVS
jgi:hypothetical protein